VVKSLDEHSRKVPGCPFAGVPVTTRVSGG
jgi:hypothetical protein